MTFCAGLRVRDGLIGIADTRVTTSTKHIVALKMVTYHNLGYDMLIMTSGLRSVLIKFSVIFQGNKY